ncbi:hypothetical protein [Methylobacterium sp. 285MFTsu5.1]|nr:hypothetical protein [Methylobacterium sp. 285MFTsu5.1]
MEAGSASISKARQANDRAVLNLTQPDLRWLVEKLRPWLDREPRI